ncbi:MAG: pyruvate formate-lyase-activating protein [Bacilli bacterium]
MGKVNSIETLGLVDGPGIRIVVFMQGCPLRCEFCHNPETWNLKKGGQNFTPEDLIKKILKYKNYISNNGGVTFSGGEPLMQKEFLLECLKLCKKNNIHTAVDTSGSINNTEEILKYTDLVILDIKAVDSFNYKKITGGDFDLFINFLNLCQKLDKKLWLRQVIIPGINDTEKYVDKLTDFIKKIKAVEKVELLPYHDMAKSKYEELGINYVLKNTPNMDKIKCAELEKKLKEGLNIE